MSDTIVISNKKRLYTTSELKDLGVSYYEMKKLVSNGKLQKLSSSVYETVDYDGEESDFYYANAYASSGVICLMSAAVYYGLSTYRPDAVDIAIERDHKVSTIPVWPPMRIFTYSKNRYETGIVEIFEDENSFRIYDIEKTVIDIVFYRNKVGIEETKEILVNYLSRKDRDLVKLHQYSRQLRCEKILRTYLEVLV